MAIVIIHLHCFHFYFIHRFATTQTTTTTTTTTRGLVLGEEFSQWKNYRLTLYADNNIGELSYTTRRKKYKLELSNHHHHVLPFQRKSNFIIRRALKHMLYGVLICSVTPSISLASTVIGSASEQNALAMARAVKKIASFLFLYAVAIPYFYKISGFRRSLRVGWAKQDFLETKPRRGSDESQVPLGAFSEDLPLVGKLRLNYHTIQRDDKKNWRYNKAMFSLYLCTSRQSCFI